MRFAPPSPREPAKDDLVSLEQVWGRLELALRDGHRSRCRGSARQPDPSKLGRAVFVDLDRAVKNHPELLERYLLTEAVTPGADVLSALHAAFWTGGTLLYVPKGVTLEAPLFSLATLGQTGRVDLSHTLVVLEEGAEATLVRETSGQGDGGRSPGLHVGALEVFLAQGARLRLVNIQNWDRATWHFSRERAIVGRDASLQWTVGGLGLAACRRSTRKSRWPGKGPRPRSTASCSPPAASIWPISPGKTTSRRTRRATCSTRRGSRTSRGSSGRG